MAAPGNNLELMLAVATALTFGLPAFADAQASALGAPSEAVEPEPEDVAEEPEPVPAAEELPDPDSVAEARRRGELDRDAHDREEEITPHRDEYETRIYFTSNATRDRVSILSMTTELDDDVDNADGRCRTPCERRLDRGEHEIEFELTGLTGTIEVGHVPLLVNSRPLNDLELGFGIIFIVLGLGGVATAAATATDACWDFTGSCSPDYGPLSLGLGLVAGAIGIGLSVDARGRVHVTELPYGELLERNRVN